MARAASRFDDPLVFCGRPGSQVGPLTVQVLGPVIRGVPGRNGFRDPVPDTGVLFEFKKDYLRILAPDPERLEEQFSATGSGTGDENGAGTEAPPATEVTDLPGMEDAPRFVPHPAFEAGTTSVAAELDHRQATTVVTDANGYASIFVEVGDIVGEFRVNAEVRNERKQKQEVEFLIVSGVEVLNPDPAEREGPVGSTKHVAIQVFERGAEEEVYDENRTAYFRIIGTGGTGGANDERGAPRLDKEKDNTNSRGVATVDLTLSRHAGPHHLLVELEPDNGSPFFRGVTVDYYAIDWVDVAFKLLGGLALLAMGLRLLASGVMIQLSPFLHLATGAFARSRVMGFLGGMAAGIAFQSSTQVIFRLVSFVNGGLLVAAAATSQLLGAHAGKTILPQILALPWIRFVGYPLIALGAVLLAAPARFRARPIGTITLGLGLVVLGWQLFGELAEVSRTSPGLTAWLQTWDPVRSHALGISAAGVFLSDVLFALVLAFVLRSSNLPVLLVMAFASRDLASPLMVVGVVAGASLGSSLSVLVFSLARKREAVRLALFNTFALCFGVVWLLAATLPTADGNPLLLHLVEWITPGRLFHPQPENVAQHVATLYTLFHLVNGLAVLGLTPWVTRLVGRIVPRDPVNDDVKPYQLDPNLIDVPSLALNQAAREVIYLVEVVRKSIAESFDAFRYRDLSLADQLSRREEAVNSVQRDVTRYLLRVSENSLSGRSASRLQSLEHAAGTLGRIVEQGEVLRDLASLTLEKGVEIPEEVLKDLTELYDLMMAQFENVLNLLENPDRRIEENAVRLGERLAKSVSRMEGGWVRRAEIQEGETATRDAALSGVALVVARDAYATLALVSRHLAHVAERMRVLAAD